MKTSYDSVSKILHWLVFLLLVVEFALGWTMPGLRHVTTLPTLVSLHFSFGVLILTTMLVRIVWRVTHRPPAFPDEMSRIMKLLARAMHDGLYLVLFIIPFSGWAWASTHGIEVSFFGLFSVPHLVTVGSPIGKTLGQLHSPLATILAFLVGFHVLAALYHHYVMKDDILVRMLPSREVQFAK